MQDFLSLDKMITPKIITFIYWLLLFFIVIFNLKILFGGYDGFTFSGLIMSFVYIAGGALIARIFCELLIVLFKMNEALQEIKNK